jgi:hypothetical protein
MIADILRKINETEAEADNILIRAKSKIADIEKDTVARIERLNTDADAEIAAKIKGMTPAAAAADSAPVKITADRKKIDAATAFATKEFYARFGK